MKEVFENLRDNLICRRKRSHMMRTYLSGKYFMFDSDNHISFCPKCQIAGKRYKAFREELESEINKEVEVPNDFASKVIADTVKLNVSIVARFMQVRIGRFRRIMILLI